VKLFGGGANLARSGLFETICSTLLAPLLALAQVRSVLSTLSGRDSGWKVLPRDDRGTSLEESVARHWGVTVIGIVWGGTLLAFAPELFPWMMPVLAGLVLAIPLSMASSRESVGQWTRRGGWLRTPEEQAPPAELRRLRAELRKWAPLSRGDAERTALQRVLEESRLCAAHLEFASRAETPDPLERHAVEGLVLKCRIQGASTLTKEEQRRILLSPNAVQSLLGS
jgi:membrane glycosyltransferase